MSRYVIDASAATEYLLRTPVGLKVAGVIADAALLAPELLDVEVLSVLRRAVLQRQLTEQRAMLAIEDLMDWSIDRIPHRPLVWAAWQHRNNVSAYDALYVAAARIANADLLTADGPLSRAPRLGVVVQNIRFS
ncbi:MAG TPA: type II toxin-antitoxin system VapC family toxin [Candidatus Limnocylindria bacterium]|nr:type II toxin-antitoxin system VapC family toxin [Candidatus Limnocylindria bacterium]